MSGVYIGIEVSYKLEDFDVDTEASSAVSICTLLVQRCQTEKLRKIVSLLYWQGNTLGHDTRP